MKRVLSWVTLFLGLNIFYYAMSLTGNLLLWVIDVAADAGIAAVILLYLVFGSLIFAIVTSGPLFASFAVVALSQRIYKSRRAVRYWVLGVVYTLYYVLFIIGLLTDFIVGGVPFVGYAKAGCMIYFCATMIYAGVNAVKEDGLPPTKRERLQAKLDKEIKKEACNAKSELQRPTSLATAKRQKKVDDYWNSIFNGEFDIYRYIHRYQIYLGHDCHYFSDCVLLQDEDYHYCFHAAWTLGNENEQLHCINCLADFISQELAPENENDIVYQGAFLTTSKMCEAACRRARQLDLVVLDAFEIIRYPSIKCVLSMDGQRLFYLPSHANYDEIDVNPRKMDFYANTVLEAETKGYLSAPEN